MKLRTGLFVGYVLIAFLAAYFIFNVFVDEIKPSARQAMEDSLVDAANLLAEVARDDLVSDQLESGRFSMQVKAYLERDLGASIWGFDREKAGFRIYVTNDQGIVRYDSAGRALGQDYSQWNDVYLTLLGKYGVRSSPESEIKGATAMHVAAPIREGGKIIGVLAVVKSNLAVEPFIQRTKNKIIRAGYWLLLSSLLIGLLMSYWLSTSVQKLVVYSKGVASGERVELPRLNIRELKILGESLRLMKERLEGKRYVEEYVLNLTHEMKSPLTAIQASAELLHEPMPEPQREKFLRAIREQSKRLHDLIEKMLRQASLEYQQNLENKIEIDLAEQIGSVSESVGSSLAKKQLKLEAKGQGTVWGDPFLISQALINLLENAIDFSPQGAIISVAIDEDLDSVTIKITDEGPGIPDYARDKIFDRFYSLPRPGSGS